MTAQKNGINPIIPCGITFCSDNQFHSRKIMQGYGTGNDTRATSYFIVLEYAKSK